MSHFYTCVTKCDRSGEFFSHSVSKSESSRTQVKKDRRWKRVRQFCVGERSSFV